MNQPARPLPELAPELSLYRNHCIALLRRYFCMSIEVGRLPALLGRECFRTNAQDYHVHSFEDIVLFVIDVERCLDRLHPFDKELIARIVIQEYSKEEAARLLHCGLRTIERRLPEALDFLTEIFLSKGMLDTTQRVSHQPLFDAEPVPRWRKRLPQRAHGQGGNPCTSAASALPGVPSEAPPKPVSASGSSHSETVLVKPPKITICAQAAVSKGNIFSLDVAGLPPPICYAEYVS